MPALPPEEQRIRVAGARVGRMATLRPDGTARLVPITFVLLDGLICLAVDDVKPKRSPRLARLDDVRRDPRAAVLVDSYAEDWTQLWWVRIDGTAEVHEAGESAASARVALAGKYPQYAAHPPTGPVLALTPTHWTGWTAS